MNTGKTLFAREMEFLPWKTFGWIVARHGGNSRVRTLSCGEQYQAMACAQLTYRESLRDIETCLSVQASKLYHMGFSEPVRRSTLADANEARDWRIYAELAERLIVQARKLYAGEDLGLELTNTVYALDSTTIDLCLPVFPWAHFRTTKSAMKMHTLLDLRGNIPSFLHISNGKMADVHALDMLNAEPGAIYVMDRGYVDFGRLHTMHRAGAFFVHYKDRLLPVTAYGTYPVPDTAEDEKTIDARVDAIVASLRIAILPVSAAISPATGSSS